MASIPYAYWMIAGLLVGAAEMVVPGFILIWFGSAAIFVGLLTMAIPDMPWPVQVFLFALFAGAAILLSRRYLTKSADADEADTLNQRGRNLLDSVVTLTEPIQYGRGRAYIKGTLWQIEGPDAPIGSTVKVVGTEDAILKVEILAFGQFPGTGQAPPAGDETGQQSGDATQSSASTSRDPYTQSPDALKNLTDPTS